MANELLDFTNKLIAAIKSPGPKKIALSTVLAVQKPRIFQKGEATDGSKIGAYSTKPISISRSRQARDTGQTYFKGGYSEYKKDIGKNPGFVNLVNTGQMESDYGIIPNGNEFGIGFQNQANADKMVWMTDKYDKEIAALNDKEVDLSITVLVQEQNKLF